MSSNDNNNSNDNTTPSTEQVGVFSCYVSPRIQELAAANPRQGQVTVAHGKVVEILGLAGLDKDTVISKRRGLGLRLVVRTPKGAEVPLIQGDTHAIWASHQRDENAQKLLAFMISKGGGELPLVSVEAVNLTSSKKAAVTAEQMEDCPV